MLTLGNPSAKLWILQLYPSDGDVDNGKLHSGSNGYELKKWGLPSPSYTRTIYPAKEIYRQAQKGELEAIKFSLRCYEEMNQFKPPIILSLGDRTLQELCPFVMDKKGDNAQALSRYAGSLLSSAHLAYPHYIVGTYSPEELFMNWKERDIVLSIDISRLREEYEFFLKNGSLQPLPQPKILSHLDYSSLMSELRNFESAPWLSTDIETIRAPKNSSTFAGHPGLVYTLGLGASSSEALSFFLNDFSASDSVSIFRQLDKLFMNVPQIYQNGHSFDQKFLTSMGFSLCGYRKSRDTRIMHHLLWPSLPHSLQFMTRQYTRQVFYKDEGKGFIPRSPKLKEQLKHYNGLDVCVTYEIAMKEMEELAERSLL